MNKAIIIRDGIKDRYQMKENDKERLKLSFQAVDDQLTRVRVDIDFIETTNFVFFHKNIFRRLVEGSYEMMHWELKKALQYITVQEKIIADQKFVIAQRDNMLNLSWGLTNKVLVLTEMRDARLKKVKSKLKTTEDKLETTQEKLNDTNCNLLKTRNELVKVQEAYEEEKKNRASEKTVFEKEIERLREELRMANEKI